MRLFLVAAVAALTFAAAAPAGAAVDRPPKHRGWEPISAQEFLARAAVANRFEIVTGQLAQQRAQSATVRALGAEFVRDHSALLAQGATVAAQLGITVPESLPPRHRHLVALLERLTGRRFDRMWLLVQLLAHRKALDLHLRAALRGDRPEIRTLALAGLPVVVRHYAQLLDLTGARR